MSDSVFERFVERSPAAVMAAALLGRAFTAERLDELFEQNADHQYEQDLLFSSVFTLMSKVVCAIRPSVNAAYQAAPSGEIDVSVTSVYNKLNALETDIFAALVRYSAGEAAPIVEELEAELPPVIEGFEVRIIDGTCIEASEHRIEELRREGAGALPGKALAVLDPQLGLVTDAFLCEDGHAQERRLLSGVLASGTVQEGQLWIADRNFSTRGFLFGLAERKAHFLIREHGNLPWEAARGGGGGEQKERPVGRAPGSGLLYEQRVRLCFEGGELVVRRIRLELDEPTRDGETEIVVLTTLSKQEASAQAVAEAYRQRWRIEHAFQELTEHLEGIFGWQRRAATLERSPDGFCELLAFETEPPGEKPYIVEVLHPAVGDSEVYHRLELFGDNRLLGIRPRARRFEIFQQHREGYALRKRLHRIAEAHVDLQPNPRASDASFYLGAKPTVALIVSDRSDLHGTRLELHAVFRHICLANLLDALFEVLRVRRTKPQKIEVARHAVALTLPEDEQRSPLQDERFLMPGLLQAVKEALLHVALQKELVLFPSLPRAVQEALAHRRRYVFESISAHRRALMRGLPCTDA